MPKVQPALDDCLWLVLPRHSCPLLLLLLLLLKQKQKRAANLCCGWWPTSSKQASKQPSELDQRETRKPMAAERQLVNLSSRVGARGCPLAFPARCGFSLFGPLFCLLPLARFTSKACQRKTHQLYHTQLIGPQLFSPILLLALASLEFLLLLLSIWRPSCHLISSPLTLSVCLSVCASISARLSRESICKWAAPTRKGALCALLPVLYCVLSPASTPSLYKQALTHSTAPKAAGAIIEIVIIIKIIITKVKFHPNGRPVCSSSGQFGYLRPASRAARS